MNNIEMLIEKINNNETLKIEALIFRRGDIAPFDLANYYIEDSFYNNAYAYPQDSVHEIKDSCKKDPLWLCMNRHIINDDGSIGDINIDLKLCEDHFIGKTSFGFLHVKAGDNKYLNCIIVCYKDGELWRPIYYKTMNPELIHSDKRLTCALEIPYSINNTDLLEDPVIPGFVGQHTQALKILDLRDLI